MGSRLYVVKGRRKKGLSKSSSSPRRTANMTRVGVGTTGRGTWRLPTGAEAKKWKPKRGRRKVGARRKLTVLETIFKWVKVPTGKVRKAGRRR